MVSSKKVIPNLDQLAALYGQTVVRKLKEANKKTKARDIENTITKTLGILQENGVYACFLYLFAKEESRGTTVVQEMLSLLGKMGFGWDQPQDKLKPETVLEFIANKVTAQLEPMLLAKETLEKMLIYARYRAKAIREE